MSTNIRSKKANGLNDATPQLGANTTSLIAFAQNATILIKWLEDHPDPDPTKLINELKSIRDGAIRTAQKFVIGLNYWNIVGTQEPSPSDFALDEPEGAKPNGTPSLQELLRIFNGSDALNKLSDENNVWIQFGADNSEKINDLKTKLEAATKEAQDAEQALTQLKAKVTAIEAQSQDESTIETAEARARVALLEQALVFADLKSAQLEHSIGTAELENLKISFADVVNFAKGAGKAIATGAKVFAAVTEVLK